MSFPRYEAYKDSGVEWLGEVPEHWEVCRITHHLQSIVDYRGRTPQKDDFGVFLVTAKNIRDGTIDYETSQEFITEKAYQEVIQRGQPSIGDVVFTTEAPLGQVANLDRDDIALAQRVIKFSGIPRVVDNYFLKYWIMGSICQSELESLATGSTALGIKGSKVNQLHFCLPSYLEQTQIARFLDRETARIDALIAEQKRLIELLKEKRQAVISHAVTKGLDPTAPMKDSGVEWLGEVPKHWGITKLKYAVSQCGGSTPSKENLDYWNGHIPWITPKDMKREFIGDSIDHISDVAIEETNLSILPEKVVLIVVRGMILAHSVPVALTTAPTTINQDMKAMIAKDVVMPEYLLILFQGMKDAIFGFVDNSAHGTKKIEWERFENVSIPLPGETEQREIVIAVTKRRSRIDELSLEVDKALTTLNERRSALISAAVTGKIDIRGWQTPTNASPTNC